MPEKPKARCWLVATHWSCGVSGLSNVFASDETGAAGLAVMQTMRGEPAPTGDLVGMLVREVTAAQLRQMLSTLESGSLVTGTVISLVPRTAAEAGSGAAEPAPIDMPAAAIDPSEPEPPAA